MIYIFLTFLLYLLINGGQHGPRTFLLVCLLRHLIPTGPMYVHAKINRVLEISDSKEGAALVKTSKVNVLWQKCATLSMITRTTTTFSSFNAMTLFVRKPTAISLELLDLKNSTHRCLLHWRSMETDMENYASQLYVPQTPCSDPELWHSWTPTRPTLRPRRRL